MKYDNNNTILKADSYKFSHPWIFPSKMTYMHNYLESRGGDFPATVFFGLQYILKKHFSNPITMEDVNQAEDFCKLHGVPFHKAGWTYIANDLKGKLPIKIRAVPEGTLIPLHNVLMTIESTDPKVFWLPGHLETLLMQIWYPITVSTKSYYTRQLILKSLNKTADAPDQEIDFKHHSFGYRGVSSCESAGIGGAAELLCSKGTDTVAGILCAMEYYNAGMCGFSIPASEHSTITTYGKDAEKEAYQNMIAQFGKPGAVFACVSDSYHLWNAIDIWGSLKEEIIKSGALLVVRPDSGDPVEVVSKTLHLLKKHFGCTVNSKGFQVLNNVRVIQGDGINYNSIEKILERINAEGFSTSNLAFGQGGGSLQKLDRDTFRMAIKASYAIVDEKGRDVFKAPITDSGKNSKTGRLDLIKENNTYSTVVLKEHELSHKNSIMRTVFENGILLIDDDFETIKNRCK